MKRSFDVATSDDSERQRQTLDYVLAEANQAKQKREQVPKVSITEARHGESHFEVASSRETTRLLFISQDTSLLNQSTQSLDGYLNMRDVFDEVHIVILQRGRAARNPVLRVADNVWMYVVAAPSGLSLLQEAKKAIVQQLEFAEGFRADLIVARDPLESGLVALWASKKYNRPSQLHIIDDYTNSQFLKKFYYPRLTRHLYRYVIKRFTSIRTSTDVLRESVSKQVPEGTNVETLPRFHNFAALTHYDTGFNIKNKYTQFSFIILYIGNLYHGCRAFQAMDASRDVMRSPKVGLVIVGDGEARGELQKRATLLGIPTQIVFEKSVEDISSYLKTADVLVVPDIDPLSDEVALQGAAAGIPLVLARTQQRTDLFTHEVSALFYENADTMSLTAAIKRVLNDLSARTELSQNARQVIDEKLHEDPLAYRLQYRESVEAALFTEDSEETPA